MATKLQLVLDKVAREPTFATLIVKDPKAALAPFDLSPEELTRVLEVVRTKLAAPPPP